MATSRGHTPPVNLKERIAALQQRSVSPNTHQSAQATPRGLPSPGSGGLRDKIAKFEEKGGVPVPRGSFGMGAPPLAENTSPKKRGELYGNRALGLGGPSGAPISRSGLYHPSTEESPGPRKRCISTGAALSNSPANLSMDEPVPALPNGSASSVPRRNSLATNFGFERRVMSASVAEGNGVTFDALSPLSSPSLSEKPPDISDSPLTVDTTPLEEEPQPPTPEAPKVTPEPSEPPPSMREPFPAESIDSNVDAPAKDLPPLPNHPPPTPDASQNSQSPVGQPESEDGLSDYESARQSAISQSSLLLPEPAPPLPSLVPTSTSAAPMITAVRTKTEAVSPPTSPPREATKLADASDESAVTTPEPEPTVAVSPPSIRAPTLLAEAPGSRSKPKFKAVVHRKVVELPVDPAASTLAPPAMSQPARQRRNIGSNVVQMSPSPGHGDLAVLLEDAALLEMRLTEGGDEDPDARELLATTPTPTNMTFRSPPQPIPASVPIERVPVSTGSGSQSMRSVSIPSIREPLGEDDIPEGDETDGGSLASTTFSQRSPSHRKYLSNIYRLTGRRSSSCIPGSYPRDSMSLSSEDSSSVTTASDSGKRKGFGIHWPSAAPKKDGPNASRSSSFADRIFNRNRTKSNVSTTNQVPERSSIYESSQAALSLLLPSELSHEIHPDGVQIDTRPTPWISSGDSNSEFSPVSSPLDKEIFDAFPSVPQTLPPGFYLDVDNANMGRASTLPVKGRKQVNQRLSIV